MEDSLQQPATPSRPEAWVDVGRKEAGRPHCALLATARRSASQGGGSRLAPGQGPAQCKRILPPVTIFTLPFLARDPALDRSQASTSVRTC